MNTPLTDDVWKRKGINILWNGDELTALQAASKVISLRRFFELHDAGWPEEQIPWVGSSALVVAGLDATVDALPLDEAEAWIEQQVYKKIKSFQETFDGQSSLIFWMADSSRWYEVPGEVAYEWHLDGKHRGQRLALGRCIWNGAQGDVRRIEISVNAKQQWIGMHHIHIS